MNKERLLAFSDGVLAVIITIMVLELHAPEDASLSALHAALPTLLSYILSFLYVAIYWVNHHHMMYVVKQVNGAVLWANMALLFFLSLVPFTTNWLGETEGAMWPTVVYGLSLLAPALAYYVLQTLLIRLHGQEHVLKRAIGGDWKGLVSPLLYLAGIGLSFVEPRVGQAFYVAVALIWLLPDPRIERVVREA
ncbi:MAG: TMEM175 family protein [Caulobacteraceae bacterium]|nr:TMEM175 family protein [Caulobacteraceae bacterium]